LPQRDLLGEVRAAVAAHETGFEVQPLREPAIEDLRSRALQSQAGGDADDALEALEQAIALSQSDPELRQLRAEALLSKGLLDEAERAAAWAYEAGPRVGSLCLRSWHTVRVAREARGTPESARIAEGMLQGCQVKPPPRM
jgi:tetratricopeptide (TPR) repeat protein